MLAMAAHNYSPSNLEGLPGVNEMPQGVGAQSHNSLNVYLRKKVAGHSGPCLPPYLEAPTEGFPQV